MLSHRHNCSFSSFYLARQIFNLQIQSEATRLGTKQKATPINNCVSSGLISCIESWTTDTKQRAAAIISRAMQINCIHN